MARTSIQLLTLSFLLLAIPAVAQTTPHAVTRLPAALVEPASFDYDAYYRQGDGTTGDDAGDVVVCDQPLVVATDCAQCGSIACGDGCCGCGSDFNCGSSCCGAGGGLLSGLALTGAIENASLANELGLAGSQWDVGGWTQFGYHDNNTQLSAARGDGLAFNDVPDGFNLQQQWFYLGKEADGSNGLDIGGRFDVVYGTDAQKTQAFGNPANSWDEGWDHGVYGWAIPQLYGEIAAGDASLKVGHFFTLVGYEVVTAPGNFFYSHSLTMFNTEPFTHTGVLGTYSGFDGLTLYGGWTLGWDTGFDNLNGGNSFIGGFAVDLLDSVTMTYMNTYGNFGARDQGSDDSYSHSVLFTVELTDNLDYIFQTDYLDVDNQQAGYFEDDFGINQYLFYGLNDVVKLGQRIEWWKDEGVSHYESTSGVNVQVLDNLIVRPEYRKDWAPGMGIDEDTFGMDMILTY